MLEQRPILRGREGGLADRDARAFLTVVSKLSRLSCELTDFERVVGKVEYTLDRPAWVVSGASAALETETNAAADRATETLRNWRNLLVMADSCHLLNTACRCPRRDRRL